MITIFVAGYPKSGTTWITRLLGDALNCKTGGSTPSEDSLEIATEIFDASSNIIVRKGHFVLNNSFSPHPVTMPHRMNWKGLRSAEHKVVLVVRDPRDIVISGAFHWKVSTRSFLNDMIKGTNGLVRIGPWAVYTREWLAKYQKFGAIIVRYESMLQNFEMLVELLRRLEFKVDDKRIQNAYERQNFKNRVIDIIQNGHKYNRGRAFNLRFMRKGVAGDWQNHFNRAEAFDAEVHFGDLLRYFNYESNPLWWKEIL